MTETDLVVLIHDIAEHGLKIGDVGTIIHCYDDKVGFEIEFG